MFHQRPAIINDEKKIHVPQPTAPNIIPANMDEDRMPI